CGRSVASSAPALPSAVPRRRFVRLDLALTHQRVDARDLALVLLDLGRAVELTGREVEPPLPQLLLRFREPVGERVVGELTQLGCAGHASSSRITKRAFNGSLWIARRIASRAICSGTPDSSNKMRPGFTTATHFSGLPLPEPMRVSAGFCVMGLSGKTLIHTLPPRLL